MWMINARTSIRLFKVQVQSTVLTQHCYKEHHTLALDRTCSQAHHVVYQRILGLIDSSNDSSAYPYTLEHSSIA